MKSTQALQMELSVNKILMKRTKSPLQKLIYWVLGLRVSKEIKKRGAI